MTIPDTIYGFSNSTAQAFADNQGKDFIPIVPVPGDDFDDIEWRLKNSKSDKMGNSEGVVIGLATK